MYLEYVVDKVAHAKSVLLAGGGPVAVELAGEIKSKYPNHDASLVSRSQTLCDKMNFNQEHSDKIKHELEKLGVKVKLSKNFNISNKKADSFHVLSPPRSYEGLDGSFDLVLNCTGSTPNTGFVPAAYLDHHGSVKVDSHLQVDAHHHPNVFAIVIMSRSPRTSSPVEPRISCLDSQPVKRMLWPITLKNWRPGSTGFTDTWSCHISYFGF